jgi:hypothetical protein
MSPSKLLPWQMFAWTAVFDGIICRCFASRYM